jgi:uncharacterized protein (UPF0262 family)
MSNRLIAIDFDASMSLGPLPDAEHERQVAIYDLLEDNEFAVIGHDAGPYKLKLAAAEGRLLFDICASDGARVSLIGLAMSPFRRVVKDYFMILDSYFAAIRHATPGQIETIDMARRGLHNEGSELLQERLKGKVEIDFDTARRLFTLISVLRWRG